MNYLSAIAVSLTYWLPFIFILELSFYVFQIPFAAIHRYAVYGVMLIKLYLECSFMTYLAFNHASYGKMEILPFFIIFALVVYFQQLKYFRNAQNENAMQLGKICCSLVLPFLIISAVITPSWLSTLYTYYVGFYSFLELYPGIGTIIHYLVYIIGYIYLVYTFIRFIIYVLSLKRAQQ